MKNPLQSKTNLANLVFVSLVLWSNTIRDLVKSNPELFICVQGAIYFIVRNIKSNISIFKK